MHRFANAVVALCLLVPAAASAADKDIFFKPGDRVVFLGDSITEQYQYSSCIELYLTTRFPKWNMFFLNAGIGGDTATGGARRFADHVLAEKPTAITINFGMNDAGYGAFDKNRQAGYLQNTEAMLAAAKKAGVRVGLVSPNAVDRRVQERFKLYLETQKQFYAPLSELAAKHSAEFVDQYAITRAALERMEKDEAKTVIPYYDGFHTSPNGGMLMAHAILTGLNAPAMVSDAKIEIGGSNKMSTTNCDIGNFVGSKNSVSFERKDDALPMPIPKEWASLLPYMNQLRDLNWYGLTITGLDDGDYTIAIDGKDVTKTTAKDLANGINLGNLSTGPVYDHAKKVFDAINAKNTIVHGRFRGVMLSQIPDWLADVAAERKPKEMAKRLESISQKQAEVYTLAQPKPHRFEVKKVQ